MTSDQVEHAAAALIPSALAPGSTRGSVTVMAMFTSGIVTQRGASSISGNPPAGTRRRTTTLRREQSVRTRLWSGGVSTGGGGASRTKGAGIGVISQEKSGVRASTAVTQHLKASLCLINVISGRPSAAALRNRPPFGTMVLL